MGDRNPAANLGLLALRAMDETPTTLILKALRGREPAFKSVAIAALEIQNDHV